MREASELFHDLYKSRWFQNTHFIVVFTKLDLFIKKLARSPIQNYFPDYKGGPDVRQAAQFFVKMFRDVADELSPNSWETFIPVLANLTTEAGTGPFWRVFDRVIQRKHGCGDLCFAPDLFAIAVLSCDGYLQPRPGASPEVFQYCQSSPHGTSDGLVQPGGRIPKEQHPITPRRALHRQSSQVPFLKNPSPVLFICAIDFLYELNIYSSFLEGEAFFGLRVVGRAKDAAAVDDTAPKIFF